MTSSVLVALRIKAPPARVFEAFTQEIALWWRPNDLFRFTPRSPGVLRFEAGEGGRFTETLASGKVFEIGRVTEWRPPSRLAFTWRQATFTPDQVTHVEVRFDPVGDETRVTVEHRGWEQIPPEHAAKHTFPNELVLHRHGEWWRTLLSALRERVQDR